MTLHSRAISVVSLAGICLLASFCKSAKFRPTAPKEGAAIENDDQFPPPENDNDSDSTVIPTEDPAVKEDSSVKITVNDKEDDFSVDPNTEVDVSWEGKNVTNCVVSPLGASGVSGKLKYKVTQNTQFKVICIRDKTPDTVVDTINVTVNSFPVPQVAIKANGTGGSVDVPTGTSVEITWTAQNADQCTISPNNWTGVTGKQSVVVTGGKVFIASCQGKGGTSQDFVTVNVTLPPQPTPTTPTQPTPTPVPIVSADLKVNGTDVPVAIPYNGSATLSWTSQNASECKIDPSFGTIAATGSKDLTQLIETKTYILVCKGHGQTIYDAVSINVEKPTAPKVDISVNDQQDLISVVTGTDVTVKWTSEFTTSCTIKPTGWTGLTGSKPYTVSALFTIFILDCTGPGGKSTDVVAIYGLPKLPSVTITANGKADRIEIPYNTTATVAWNAENSDSCTVSPDNWTGITGSKSTGALKSSKTYVVNCKSKFGSTAAIVEVAVTPEQKPNTITATLKGNGVTGYLAVPLGSNVDIEWTSENADSCTISPQSWTGVKGTKVLEKVNTNVTLTLKCTGAAGSATSSLYIFTKAVDKAYVDIKINGSDGPVKIPHNTSVLVTWTSAGVSSCKIQNYTLPVVGTMQSPNIVKDGKYTIICDVSTGGTVTDTALIYVSPQGISAQMVGVNFEDMPVNSRDGDFNDSVLCFKGLFRVTGQKIVSEENQSVRITTSKISKCNHTMQVFVKSADGTLEKQYDFASASVPVFYLDFKRNSVLEVIMIPKDTCQASGSHDNYDPTWAVVKVNECRTTGI